MKASPILHIAVRARFAGPVALEPAEIERSSISFLLYRFTEDGQTYFFYECKVCGHAGCPSFQGQDIPDEVVARLKLHAVLNH